MDDWMRGRSGWVLFVVIWGFALTGALLGVVASWAFFGGHRPASVASDLLWPVGGSLFVALGGTLGAMRSRRRRQG